MAASAAYTAPLCENVIDQLDLVLFPKSEGAVVVFLCFLEQFARIDGSLSDKYSVSFHSSSDIESSYSLAYRVLSRAAHGPVFGFIALFRRLVWSHIPAYTVKMI